MFQRKTLIIFVMLFVLSGTSKGQQESAERNWRFHSINNMGLLEGEAGSALQLQTINGAGYKTWFAGVGVGLDYYRYRSIPLFLDLRKEFGKRNKIFIYTDLGISFPWVTESQKNIYQTDDRYSNGFYNDLGLGYKISVGSDYGFLVSLGYSFKKLTESYPSYPPYVDFRGPTANIPREKVQYSLNRLTLKLGWEF